MTISKQQFLAWLGFAFIILIEFLLFQNYITREIIPYYPKSYDQTVYLLESYKLYENMLAHGRIIKYLVQLPLLPQTLLFHPQAALFFVLFGASRFSALMINFTYLALLQLISFLWLKDLTGRYRYGFIFIGLLLTARTLLMAADFRIDFIACCLYGLLCCAILRSELFLSRRYTIISMLIGIVLISMRYVTICYVLGLAGVLFSLFSLQRLLAKREQLSAINARIKNLILFTAGILVMIAPVLFINRDIIYNYYIVGHVTGAEKLMRLKVAMRAWDLSSPYLFYPKVFWASHFSSTVCMQFAVIILFYLSALAVFRRTSALTASSYDKMNNFLFLLISIMVPAFILSMDASKSVLVISVILVPFIYAMVFLLHLLSETLWTTHARLANASLSLVTTFFLIVGFYNFSAYLSRDPGHQYSSDVNPTITVMVDDIGSYASFLRWDQIRAASDFLADYINAPIGPLFYERKGYLLDVTTLPLGNNGITPVSRETALQSLAEADIYTTNLNDYSPDKIFPFEQSIQPFRAELQKFAASHMIQLGDYYLNDTALRVYARPDIRINGMVDGWITNHGIALEIPVAAANQIQTIELQGRADVNLPEKLDIRGHIIVDGEIISIPVVYTHTNHHYQITCTLPEQHTDKPLIINLKFISENPAEKLMMLAPESKTFTLRQHA